MLATTSRASTGSLSWKRRPSRSFRVQVNPSSSTVWPSTICGCAFQLRVDAVKRVEHQISVVTRRPIEGDDRIENGERSLVGTNISFLVCSDRARLGASPVASVVAAAVFSEISSSHGRLPFMGAHGLAPLL